MDNSDKENYFSIYMQKKESNNKKKKLSPEKSNKTLKTSNFSNLHIPQGQSLKKLVFNSEKKEKTPITFIRNKFPEKNLKETITINKNNIDDDKKIDMLEARIFDILDLIDNFQTEYINKNERISFKEKIKNHFDKSNNLNKIEIKNINNNPEKDIKKKLTYRSISSKNNIENTEKIFMTNTNINHINLNNNKKNNNKNNKNLISNINFNTNNNTKVTNINFRNLQKPHHKKSNSQLLNTDKKIRETILQRRVDYANLINQKYVKKKKKQLSQSQVFVNKNILYYSPKTKKFNPNLYVELGSDNSSTREISEKVFIKVNNRKKKNKPSINSTKNNNKIGGFKINNFKQLNRITTDNLRYKCDSERTQKLTNITKKYKFDFENF